MTDFKLFQTERVCRQQLQIWWKCQKILLNESKIQPEKEKLLVYCLIYMLFIYLFLYICFLAHLSTTCSRGAFRVVRCPSSVMNNFFKHFLLLNRWANLDQTWQECSLGGPLQKLFTEFDSIKNSGCHGNKIEFLAHLSTTCSRGAFRVVRCLSCVVRRQQFL